MNREIKFRAWDKKNLIIRTWNWLLDCVYTKQFYLFEDNNFIFQQFTGLLDKHGKEIYEGDIIKASWNSEKINDDRIGVIKDIRAVDWYMSDGFLAGHDESNYGNREIIGNIYENPELLN